MVLITIVNGVYTPTYNWGAPPCMYIYIYVYIYICVYIYVYYIDSSFDLFVHSVSSPVTYCPLLSRTEMDSSEVSQKATRRNVETAEPAKNGMLDHPVVNRC